MNKTQQECSSTGKNSGPLKKHGQASDIKTQVIVTLVF